MKLSELRELGPGNSVVFDNIEDEKLEIFANNQLIAKGEVVVEKGKIRDSRHRGGQPPRTDPETQIDRTAFHFFRVFSDYGDEDVFFTEHLPPKRESFDKNGYERSG
jgi:hypothetical protein